MKCQALSWMQHLSLISIVMLWASGPLAAQDEASKEKDKEKSDAPVKEGVKEKPAAKEAIVPPAPVSDITRSFWTIEFDAKKLGMISPTEGVAEGRVYWYLLYDLKNASKEDRQVYVTVTATSDDRVKYSDVFLPSVEKAIERKEREPLWGKTDEFEILSKRDTKDPKYRYVELKAGATRKCVAVFNRFDANASKIKMTVTGLSNELRTVVKDDGTKELEERVRELYYERPGDEYEVTADSFKLTGKDWVKRRVPLAAPKDAAPK
jgi:hypothetical protein